MTLCCEFIELSRSVAPGKQQITCMQLVCRLPLWNLETPSMLIKKKFVSFSVAKAITLNVEIGFPRLPTTKL